ncbi:MAG: DUF4126 domain-containing protein [Candidatus Rokubacteria bacterium]|nr:DUF4126 domain-containing protein [Candidatus Rokubacteria bacterium]
MDTLAVIGSALALSLAAGLSLYGAAFLLGLAVRLEWLRLAPGWEPVAVLADPVVLTVAGVLAAIEFLADKIPWLDSAWDAVHTVIRPIGGALLASRVLGGLSPEAEVIAFLLLGGATFATHAAKASVRLVVNASPEPFSNVLVSLFENSLVVGAVWLAVSHPFLALGAGLLALALAVAATAWLFGRTVRALCGLWGRVAWRAPTTR